MDLPGDRGAVVFAVLLSLYGVSIILAIGTAAFVYIPRVPKAGGSPLHFEDIGAMTFESFEHRAVRMDPVLIERQLLEQVHVVSKIASRKMKLVRWAYYSSAPSILLWVSLLGWGSV